MLSVESTGVPAAKGKSRLQKVASRKKQQREEEEQQQQQQQREEPREEEEVASEKTDSKKKRRFKASTLARRAIHKEGNKTDAKLHKSGLKKMIRSIVRENNPERYITENAFKTILKFASSFILYELTCGRISMKHAKRVTLHPADLNVSNLIRKEHMQ